MNSEVLRSDLEADINIRRNNLASIKTLSSRYPFKEIDKSVWARCSFPIIYAEWEGFFVNAMTLYLREINGLSLTLNQLEEKYYVNNIEKHFKQFKEYPSNNKKKANFLYALKDFYTNTERVQLLTEINTESNLGFNVLNTILSDYGIENISDHLDHDACSYKDKLEKFLLDKRNGLAHGDPATTVITEDINEAILLVDRLMEEVKERLLKALENEVFMKSVIE